ncbi:kinesin-like protein KIF27 isoform X2 [Engraulis encrasicolus]|uniref:kinesin-like protein KIF27 isoform X2 n=1 Tax=Engraulis encrasicolus TaxID=184585 RepID=UPI002FD47B0A
MMEKVMRVAVRVRPLHPAEIRVNKEICANVSADSRQVTLAGGHTFPCDFAFGPTVSQERVYCSSLKPLVVSLFAGRDVTVLTYGQAGSGKSYTLCGKHGGDRGAVWRVCEDILHQMTAKEHSSRVLSACCVALCGHELRDVLARDASQANLFITEDQNGRTVVDGAAEVPVGSMKDVQNVLKCVSDVNHKQPSSHTLLWLRLRQRGSSNNHTQAALFSTLMVVDLAGWECVSGLVSADPSRFKRSLQISTELRPIVDILQQPDRLPPSTPASRVHTPQTLSSHSHVHKQPRPSLTHSGSSDVPKVHSTRALCVSSTHSISSQQAHVSHSPLVRLLQNSLTVSSGGQTLLLVCVSPARSSLADTASCLMLAARAQDKYVTHADDLAKGEQQHPRDAPSGCGAQGRLVHNAAALLEEMQQGYSLSADLQQRLSSWLDAYQKTPHSPKASDHTLGGTLDGGHQVLNCAETEASLTTDTHSCQQSLQELKLHCRLQSELLVEQKLLAEGLRREHHHHSSSDMKEGQKRVQSCPHTARLPAHLTNPLIRSATAVNKNVRSSVHCVLGLERLWATLKSSNQLLLARQEEQEEVPRLPSSSSSSSSAAARRPRDTEARGDTQSGKDKRRSAIPLLNRTWTRKHSNPDLSPSTPESQDNHQAAPGPRGACEGQGSLSESRSAGVIALQQEKERLMKRRDELRDNLAAENTDTEKEDRALHLLEETMEAVDAVIEMRQHPDQQGASVTHQLTDNSDAVPIDSLGGLEDLSPQEAKALFHMFLSKAVRERGRCASQQRRVGELEGLLSSEREQSSSRLQQLEKEVFFYRSSSRELRRRLKELVQDAPPLTPPSTSSGRTSRVSGDGGLSHGQ